VLPPASELPVTAADVDAAAARIDGAVVTTPFAPSRTLSAITGADVMVKFENLQFTASFKERGACNRLRLMDDATRARGVVAASAGNHGQAVAHHAALLGISATIVMPEATPFVKVTRTEALGASIVQTGADFQAARHAAIELAEHEGATFVSAYDDAAVIAGQGTLTLEMLAADPDLDTLVVPVGGGGLLAGMAVAARARAPHIELVGVQAAACPSMVTALAEGPRVVPCTTIAEGIAVSEAGVLTTEIIGTLVDDVVTVSETHLEEAISLYLEVEKVVAEGAGAASLAALLEHPDRFRGRRVGLVLSGGNIDPRLLTSVILRSLARTGRLTRLVIDISDTPGALGKIATIVGRSGANIVEVEHRRDVLAIGLKGARLVLVIETRDRPHVDEIVQALGAEGYGVTVDAPT
jgi:threonine dehydratase